MRLIREETVLPAALTSSVAISELPWTAGTYVTGQQRYVGTDLYEVVADPSTTDEPTAGAASPQPELRTWVRIGKINRWRMFSEFVAEQTVAPSPIEVEIATAPSTNSVALFGLNASEVEVITYSGGVETGRVTRSMTNTYEVADWYEYFFQPIVKIEEGVILDLPSYGTDRIVVRIINGETTAAVGKLVIGEQAVIGHTKLQYGAGFEDYSIKERDDFGGFMITERRFARRAEFNVLISAVKLAGVIRDLANVRAKPTVYIGDPDVPETIVIGFFKDAWATRQTREWAEMTLEIEGLT